MSANFTPGAIYALWEVLNLLINHEQYCMREDALVNTLFNVKLVILNTGLIKKCIDLGIELDFLSRDCDHITLSRKALLEINGIVDVQYFFQFVLKKLLIKEKPFWIGFFEEDIDQFIEVIPANWVDLLDSGSLLDFSQATVIDWWKEIIQKVDIENELLKKEIGDIGEEFTIKFEIDRLSYCGIPNYEKNVNWVAKISDRFGYDISSLAGDYDLVRPNKPIMIEVKASMSFNLKKIRFYVTKNEWVTASNNPNTFFFYIWQGVDLTRKKKPIGPRIVPALRILDRFPLDNDPDIQWTISQIILDTEEMSY